MTRYIPIYVLAILVLLTDAALAQTVITVPSIDLSPIKSVFIDAVSGALIALATWIGWKIKNLLKLKEDSEVRAYLDAALMNAANYAVTALKDKTADFGKVEVKNELVATAANYAIKYVPDAIAYFGIKPEDVASMVAARLNKVLGTDKPEVA